MLWFKLNNMLFRSYLTIIFNILLKSQRVLEILEIN